MCEHVPIYLFAVCVVEHAVHDVLGQFGLVGVTSSTHPGVNDALIVCAFKWNLQKNIVKPNRELYLKQFKRRNYFVVIVNKNKLKKQP